MSEFEGADRRLGWRLPVSDMWVTWRLDRPDRRPLRQRRFPLERQFGRVVDLSVSGARIIAPFAADLRVGSLIRIEIEGHKGTVAIHRVEPTDAEGLWSYGVSFVDFPPKFTDKVYARLDAFQAENLEGQWMQSK